MKFKGTIALAFVLVMGGTEIALLKEASAAPMWFTGAQYRCVQSIGPGYAKGGKSPAAAIEAAWDYCTSF